MIAAGSHCRRKLAHLNSAQGGMFDLVQQLAVAPSDRFCFPFSDRLSILAVVVVVVLLLVLSQSDLKHLNSDQRMMRRWRMGLLLMMMGWKRLWRPISDSLKPRKCFSSRCRRSVSMIPLEDGSTITNIATATAPLCATD